MHRDNSSAVGGIIVPRLPHPLLAADKNEGWQRIRDAYESARQEILALKPDVLVLYSTGWPCVIGHQIQADPNPKWVHVDQQWHHYGSMPYEFRIDEEFAEAYRDSAEARGLHARTVSYKGFPIDTGSIVALKLLNPDNAIPATIVSCNMYADRAETLVLGKAAMDAAKKQGKRAVMVAVTALSNRMHTRTIEPKDDAISSLKDDEWNRKVLEFLAEGRLEDVSQLARQFHREANADSKFKAIWWLAAALGQSNQYQGKVHAYAPIYGTGAAVVSLVPAQGRAVDQEFDEDDVEVFGGDRGVLSGQPVADSTGPSTAAAAPSPNSVHPSGPTPITDAATPGLTSKNAPKAVGAYPHARRVGDLLYLSGVGPRQAGTNAIPGGPVWNEKGEVQDYDVEAQTRAVIANIKAILEDAGSSLENVLDISVYLVDMQRDFKKFNQVYADTFSEIGATRTTIEVKSLPTPIAVEFKVIAQA